MEISLTESTTPIAIPAPAPNAEDILLKRISVCDHVWHSTSLDTCTVSEALEVIRDGSDDWPGRLVRYRAFLDGNATPAMLAELAGDIAFVRQFAPSSKEKEKITKAHNAFVERPHDAAAREELFAQLKKGLPGFIFAGRFSQRSKKHLLEHSGLLVIDKDDLADHAAAQTAREDLRNDPCVLAAWVSPSGRGIKALVRVPVVDSVGHETRVFTAAANHFAAKGITLDPTGKDVSRLCFVGHDPGLWINSNATQLDVPEDTVPGSIPAGSDPEQLIPSSCILLPSHGCWPFTRAAERIFTRIAEGETLFDRGGRAVRVGVDKQQRHVLKEVTPDEFRSILEKHGTLCLLREGKGGSKTIVRDALCSTDTAKALLAAEEARTLLPGIRTLSASPVLVEDEEGSSKILGQGYHPEGGGIYVSGSEEIPVVPEEEAVAALTELFADYLPMSPSDLTRAIAFILTPALLPGGVLTAASPVFVLEADQCGTGKGLLAELREKIYGETAYAISQSAGGVGGAIDEKIQAALASGRRLPRIDNFVGRFASPYFEAATTINGLMSVRTPYSAAVEIDVRGVSWCITSNGMQGTPDLARRCVLVRMRKQPPGYVFRSFNGLGLLDHAKANQRYLLGCVYTIVRAWIEAGKPRSNETRHSFREWGGALDEIMACCFPGLAPLLDGHARLSSYE